MFYCRAKELSDLNRRYREGKFECAIVYGRKRVGKTALINEFCKNKPTFFLRTECNIRRKSGGAVESDL